MNAMHLFALFRAAAVLLEFEVDVNTGLISISVHGSASGRLQGLLRLTRRAHPGNQMLIVMRKGSGKSIGTRKA
eukprot:1157018-Pelagomonas_calceolata.AAC.3